MPFNCKVTEMRILDHCKRLIRIPLSCTVTQGTLYPLLTLLYKNCVLWKWGEVEYCFSCHLRSAVASQICYISDCTLTARWFLFFFRKQQPGVSDAFRIALTHSAVKRRGDCWPTCCFCAAGICCPRRTAHQA